MLTLGGIEAWEDKHPRGLYDMYWGWIGQGDKHKMPHMTEMVDLVREALVGGGMESKAADGLLAGLGPAAALECLPAGIAALEAALAPEPETAETGEDTGSGKGLAGSTSGAS